METHMILSNSRDNGYSIQNSFVYEKDTTNTLSTIQERRLQWHKNKWNGIALLANKRTKYQQQQQHLRQVYMEMYKPTPAQIPLQMCNCVDETQVNKEISTTSPKVDYIFTFIRPRA